MINPIKKRFWEHKFKTWFLPMCEYTNLLEWFRLSNITVVQCTDDAVIWNLGDGLLTITLNKRLENYSEFMSVPGLIFDRQNKKYTIPLEQLDEVTHVFENGSLTFRHRKI